MDIEDPQNGELGCGSQSIVRSTDSTTTKPRKQHASQHIAGQSMPRNYGEQKGISSSKLSVLGGDVTIASSTAGASSASSTVPGNVAVDKSNEKKPTLDVILESQDIDRKRNAKNASAASPTSNISSIRTFLKKASPMKRSFLSFFKKGTSLSISRGKGSSDGRTGKKPTLDEVFEAQDLAALPNSVQGAPRLLEQCINSLKTSKFEDAKSTAINLISMVENHFAASPENVRLFGRKLQEKKLYLESIVIFDTAAVLFEKMGQTEENLEMITSCVAEMTLTNEAMIGDDASMKFIVTEHVIPLMREKLGHIEEAPLVSEQFKCLQMSWILHSIEFNEYLVEEWEECEKTLRFALNRMKDVFDSDVTIYRVYGYLLHNLGFVCENTSRFGEAASLFKQAIDAKKAAIDFDNEELRQRRIAESEYNLKNCSAENEVTFL